MVCELAFSQIRDSLIPRFKARLDENDLSFLTRVYSSDITDYITRLQALGFNGAGVALDAGCGFGQWSICLSQVCGDVRALDYSQTRADFTGEALRIAGVKGKSSQGSVSELPWEDETFDVVFCYGTIFCTPWEKSLREFARVLKYGGKLYFSANGIGYIMNMWMNRPNLSTDFDPREAAANTFRNTLEYEKTGKSPSGGQILIDEEQACTYLSEIGFSHILVNPEGKINLDPEHLSPKSFFKSDYFGLPGCYEVLASKL